MTRALVHERMTMIRCFVQNLATF